MFEYKPSTLRQLIQRPQTGRKTTGEHATPFHRFRTANFLTQSAAARLLGVTATTTHRWDTIWDSAPALLEPAMRFHHIMRAVAIDHIRPMMDANQRAIMYDISRPPPSELHFDEVIHKLRESALNAALISNLERLDEAGKQALAYGIMHGLFYSEGDRLVGVGRDYGDGDTSS